MLRAKCLKALIYKGKPCNHLRLQGFFFGAEGEIRTLKLSFKPVENTALFIFMANIVAKLREELFHFLHRLGNVCLCDVCIDFTHCSVV